MRRRYLQAIGLVEQQSDDTPSHRTGRMRAAPGRAITCLACCERTGPRETRHAPANCHLNDLKSSVAEKPRPWVENLSNSLSFSRSPPDSCAKAIPGCPTEREENIVLHAASRTREIPAVVALSPDDRVSCLRDPGGQRDLFPDNPVVRDLVRRPRVDVIA